MNNIYKVTELDGNVHNIVAKQSFVERYYPGRWELVGPEPGPPPPPPIITKLAFRFRLTDQEYVGILAAAKTSVEVAAWVETFNMVSQVNLLDKRTKDGLNSLVAAGLLTEARVVEILNNPIEGGERPQ